MDDNEIRVIAEVSKNADASQRELSKILNLSLGMTNIVLHRLIEKGFMKIRYLDGRKVQYTLTPKGILEKSKKARQYLQKTIDTVSVMKETMKDKMKSLAKQGNHVFYVLGGWELMHIIELAVKEMTHDEGYDVSCTQINDIAEIKEKKAVVFCGRDIVCKSSNGRLFINITQLLAEKMI